MLEEISNFENLGSPSYFLELIRILKIETEWSKVYINRHFFDRMIDWRNVFDWCINLWIIAWVIIEDDLTIKLNKNFSSYTQDNLDFRIYLLRNLIFKIKDDIIFNNIFSYPNISYDLNNHAVEISNVWFWFKYRNFKQLLIDFWFITPSPDVSSKFLLNKEYKVLYDELIFNKEHKRKMWMRELNLILEKQQIEWEKAELYVIQYEKNRLEWKKSVSWVAEYDVCAWYDIASFNDIASIDYDRYIEVKSYIWKKGFYWSKNEVETSKIKGETYFIYLINREKMYDADYIPEIIQNPIQNILKNNNWFKEIDKYYISNT